MNNPNDLISDKQYIAIDLKSFYASVECVDRKLDPLKTNLVVADESRTAKTICLAVSPSLKVYGIPGRARLFEVISAVERVNNGRLSRTVNHSFTGSSYNSDELDWDTSLKLDYIIAPPRMRLYMAYSTRIFNIYQKYISPDDILVYSIDECFIDVTNYLSLYKMSARELCQTMIKDVYTTTGITATAGIGTNLYLCKIAMDIVAKHAPADEDGVRIAELNELTYRQQLWTHEPLTDFWRVGRGIANKLISHGLYTMGDVALCSLGGPDSFYNEDLLYKLFGVNAELLIDHAWGYEPATISASHQYTPENNSISTGQVLKEPYTFDMARIIIREMTDLLVLDLVDKKLVTNQLVITVGYDIECLTRPEISKLYKGPVTTDHYGRKVPKHAHGTTNLDSYSSSTSIIIDKVLALYDSVVNHNLLIRRINVVACRVINENSVPTEESCNTTDYEQLNLFTDYSSPASPDSSADDTRQKLKLERNLQEAVITLQKKFGKNAVLKGTNLQEGATTIERNGQVGGHKG